MAKAALTLNRMMQNANQSNFVTATKPASKPPNLYVSLRSHVRRRIRLSVESTVAQLSFPLGWRWLSWWCRHAGVIRAFYPREYDLFPRVVSDLGLASKLHPHAHRLFLAGNIVARMMSGKTMPMIELDGPRMSRPTDRFFKTLFHAMDQSDVSNPNSFWHITGMSHVTEVLQKGRGVILLTFHTTAMLFATPEVARQLGSENIWTLSESEARRWHQRMQGTHTGDKLPPNPAAYVAEITNRAQQMLRRGGVLQIANDHGYEEIGTSPYLIGKRNYQLKPGFAELAMATGAAVIPYYSNFKPDGHLRTHFMPPMAMPESKPVTLATRRQVVHELVGEYAKFVESGLYNMPEALTWGAVMKYLRQPPSG